MAKAAAPLEGPETTIARMGREVHTDLSESVEFDPTIIVAIITAIMQLFGACKKSADDVAAISTAQADGRWYLGYLRHRAILERQLGQCCPAHADLVRAAIFDRAKSWDRSMYQSALNEVK